MSHGGQWVSLKEPECQVELELNVYPPGSRFATPYRPGEVLDRLGFAVTDARGTIERLRGTGTPVAVDPWPEAGRHWFGFVEGPEGLWIEIQGPVAEANSTGADNRPSDP